MAYVDIPNGDDLSESFLNDIARRKEFASLKRGVVGALTPIESGYLIVNDDPTVGITLPPRLEGLQLHGAQMFVRAFKNPNTPYSRILVNWQTGAGKTLGMLAMSQEYAHHFRSQVHLPPDERPTVFIISFSKDTIQSEMLSFPELGFVTAQEIVQLEKAKARAASGAYDTQRLNVLLGTYKRRITNRLMGGYYQFYGYKEFANRIFVVTPKGVAAGFDPSVLFDNDPENIVATIDSETDKGHVHLNLELINKLKGCLIVADEIQKAYNVQTKNNYGVALQYVLDSIEDGNTHAIFMSATPMSGSATAIVDLLNLLVPKKERANRILRRDEFFEGATTIGGVVPSKLRKGALERIKNYSRGRVSFMLEPPSDTYPARYFKGVSADGIQYLKFELCVMSKIHEKIARGYEEQTDNTKHSNTKQYLYDTVFPASEWITDESSIDGYTIPSSTLLSQYASLPQPKQSTVFTANRADHGSMIASGSALRLPELAKMSTKLAHCMKMLIEFIKQGTSSGKIMLYHHLIQTSGVLLVESVLRENGVISQDESPTSNTLCVHCGETRDRCDAAKKTNHEFAPVRYAAVHSFVRANMLNTIARFNRRSNAHGKDVKILIGSGIISVGITLKAVRHQLILAMPSDIPTLLQVFGRCVRNRSHEDLPKEDRNVSVYVLVSTYEDGSGPELDKYRTKMGEYCVIQTIEKTLRTVAVDAFSNVSTIPKEDTIDSLTYKPAIERAPNNMISDSSFLAYGWGIQEVGVITSSILALYKIRPVWTYDDLWNAVSSNTVSGVSIIESTMDERNFAIALHKLCDKNTISNRQRNTFITFADPYYIATNDIQLDYDSYTRSPSHVDVKSYLLTSVIDNSSHTKLLEMLKVVPMWKTLMTYAPEVHYTALRAIVEDAVMSGVVSNKLSDMMNMYASLKILITVGDVIESESARRLYRGNDDNDKHIIGFVSKRAISIYDTKTGWYELPKNTIPLPNYTENMHIVGYAERKSGLVRFKLRPPLVINATHRDKRVIQTGAVCNTYSRKELSVISANIGISTRAEDNIDTMCSNIQKTMIDNEIRARSNESTQEEKQRWVYLFNELVR
jgi:hypothetical protein